MKIKLNLCLSALLFLFAFYGPVQQSYASHIVGSDISYKCTATPGIFEVTLVLFRKCNGGAVTLCPTGCGAACPQTMSIQGADPSCSSSTFGSISLSLVSVRDADVKPHMPITKNTCTNMGCTTPGTYTPSVERYEFKGFANLGSTSGIPASCCNIRFAYSLCCRNGDIGTGPANANFYVDAVINRCLSTTPCNSSPEFKADPFIEICGNQYYIHNNSTSDPDDDSLSYAFTPALQGFNDPVLYNPPFAYDRPMPWTGNATGQFPTGIHCDAVTGEVSFTPPNSGGLFSGVIAIEVKQWKKVNGVHVVVGITRRDIQVVVRGDCPINNTPWLQTTPYDSFYYTPKTNWEVCAGNQLCFTVTGKDTDFNLPSVSDTTFLTWDGALDAYGATFEPTYSLAHRDSIGPREDAYRFCWTPSQALARNAPYVFTITAMDKRLPSPGRLRKGFFIKVIGQPNIAINKTNKQCGKWQVSYTKNNSSQTFSSTSIQVAKQPFDYSFTGGATTATNTTTTPVMTFTKGGNYLVKVDIQMGSCSKTFYDTLMVDTPFTAGVNDTLVCAGTQTQLTVKTSYGLGAITYRWYNSILDTAATPLNAPNFTQPTFTVSPNSTKNYVVAVKDSSGCTIYTTAMVQVKNNIRQLAVSHIKCNGQTNGSILINDTITTSTYQYKLNNGAFVSGKLFNNLAAGLYSITAQDTGGCNSVQEVTITQPAILKDTLTSVTPQLCIGASNGTITAFAKGGTAPYRYSIDSVQFDTTRLFSNLQPGVYKIHIRDTNLCYTSFTKTVLPADSIKHTTTIKNVTCFGLTTGEVKISATGGKKPFTYQRGSAAFVTDSIFKNLAAGGYTFTIKDANGCLRSFTDTVKSPAALQQNAVIEHVTCYDAYTGSVQVLASGGTPPYLYKNPQTALYDTVSLFKNLHAGTYPITIKDNQNCLLNFSKVVQQPTAIVPVTIAQGTTCFENTDGKITVSATGGVPPYTYSIDSGSFGAATLFTLLPAGNHVVIVRDSLLCKKGVVTAIAQPQKVDVTVSKQNISCFNKTDGKITVTPIKGKSPFTYSLSGSAYTAANIFTNLAAGSYLVGVKDSMGCSDTAHVTLTAPPTISVGAIGGPTTSLVNVTDTFSIAPQLGLNIMWATEKGTIVGGKTASTMYVRWDSVGTGIVGVAVYQDTTCGDTASMNVNIGSVGLNELANHWGLRVYPNPANNHLNIQLQQLPESTTIQLYDVQGRLVIQQDLKLSQQLNLESLTPGMYLLKIGAWSGQVVKE